MATPIEQNKQENIDLLQIEYFSDLPVSKKEIVVIESSNAIAIAVRKFLVDLGYEDIHICKEAKDGIKLFYHFISIDVNVPLIIDSSSDINIKNTIKEILEIQPNAKIIVTTTKGKTDSFIQELYGIGISSVIQKPISFEEFKNAFSYIDEKNHVHDSSKGKIMGGDLTTALLLSSQISFNRLKDILKTDQSKTEEKIKELLEERKIVLEGEILEAACNQCDSANITFSSECPNCHGINFKQNTLIEHYRCGKIFPEETQKSICPQCKKELGSPGTDYREFSESYTCSSCSDKFPKPLSKFICLDCGNNFIDKLATWKKNNLYKVQK